MDSKWLFDLSILESGNEQLTFNVESPLPAEGMWSFVDPTPGEPDHVPEVRYANNLS